MVQYFSVAVTFGRHHGRTYLAQADTMPPATSFQNDLVTVKTSIKVRTFKV